MNNRRVFYAVREAGIAIDGTSDFLEIHGLQSIGITTNFNLEQVFEMGQLSIYQNIEQVPDIEVTVSKGLDGYPLIYHLATNGSTSPTLTGRSNQKCIVAMSVFSDTGDSASGTPISEVHMSGMFVSALTYNFPGDGNFTEEVTLVGNNKLWIDTEANPGQAVFIGMFNNLDQPLNISSSGGIQRRQHIVMAPISGGPSGVDVNGASNGWVSVWPKELFGINASGINAADTDGTFLCPIQSVTVTADLGRDTIFELGRKSPYWRFVTFPVEVRTEIEIIDRKWDNVGANDSVDNNTNDNTIRIRTKDGTSLYLGLKNRLTTVATTGGDAAAGGGNVTQRYTYQTFNDLIVTQPQDPSGLTTYF